MTNPRVLYMQIFADDAKMIVDPDNFKKFQLCEAQWCLKCNVQKCTVMPIGLSILKNH